MPAALNCPNCGAAASGPTATRCEYCTSALTSMACPSCFGGIFAGMQFCPHCGAKGDRAVGESDSLACPGCKAPMTAVRVGVTPLFECAECESTWLASDTFTRLCLDRESHGAIVARVGTSRPALPSAGTGGVRYLPCPMCKRVMNRENFGRRSGVIIDVCKGHGVWFERQELQRVLAFIDSGGLERSRALDSERLREQERKTREQRDRMGRDVVVIRTSETHTVVLRSNDQSQQGPDILGEALKLLFS